MHKFIFMKIYLSIILLFISLSMYSQIGVGTTFTEGKWRTGGGLNVGFAGNNAWFLSVNPFVGYMVHPRMEVGATAGYFYSSSNYIKTSMLSVGPYTNLYLFPSIFGRIHYEHLNGRASYPQQNIERTNFSEDALWLGAGYQTRGRVRMQIGIQYNVLYDSQNSIFTTPWRQFGGVALSL